MHVDDKSRCTPLSFSQIKRMYVDDKSRCSAELLALANGPLDVYSYTACIVNGVRFVVHSRDLNRTTQNSGVSTTDADGRPYYGVLEEILELCYLGGRKVVLFRCKWFKTDKQGCLTKDNITSICTRTEWYKEEQYILATQATQVFYLDDPVKRRGESGKYWKVVQEVHHRKIWDRDINDGDIEVDLLHGSNSSDILLSSNLDDFTPTGLSRGEVIELEPIHTVEDDDTDDDMDDDMEDDMEDDMDDDIDNELDICDESD